MSEENKAETIKENILKDLANITVDEKDLDVLESIPDDPSVSFQLTTSLKRPTSVSDNNYAILLIDDKPNNRSFYSSTLLKAGFKKVLIAATEKDALNLFQIQGRELCLIIINWDSDIINAPLLIQKTKIYPDNNYIEVLIYSSEISEEDSFLLKEIDINYSITGGITPKKLIDKVTEIKKEYLSNFETIKSVHEFDLALINSDIDACLKILDKNTQLKNVITTIPKYAHYMGEFYLLKKESKKAISYLKQLLDENKAISENASNPTETVKILATLGKAYCLNNEYETAIMIFNRLASKSPKNLNYKINQGEILLNMNRTDEAKEKFKDALAIDENNKDALIGMGKVEILSNNIGSAKSFFARIKGNFESRTLASFFNNRAVALARKGNPQDAIEFYQNAVPLFQEYQGTIYFNLGSAYYRLGQYKNAMDCFEKALSSKQKDMFLSKTIIEKTRKKIEN